MARRRIRLVTDADVPDDRVPDWEEIARDHRRFLFTVAYRLCGDHEEAEDVVQTALVRVERGLETYRPDNLRAWLARITTNVFLDEARRRTRRPQVPLGDRPDHVLAGAPGADEALDAASLPGYIQEAILQLGADHRSALVLCDVVGLSYPEIAEVLGVPVGTVRSRISRARGVLRDLLAPHLGDGRAP